MFGSIRVVAPTAMIAWPNVIVSSPTVSEWSSVKLAHPLYSVMPFFFMRKCTPLTRPSATLRLRCHAWP